MSAIELLSVLEYSAGFKRPLQKGALLAKSKTHFFGYGRFPNSSQDSIHFITSCLTSKLSAKPHTVNVIKTSLNGEVQLRATCSCKANTGRCKHIVGFMLKLERISLSEIPILSRMDVARKWGKLNENRLEAQKPCRFLDLCHVKLKSSKYKALPNSLPVEVEQFVYADILKAFPESIAYKMEKKLNTIIPEDSDTSDNLAVPLSYVLQAVFQETSIVTLNDDILFELYACQQEEINFYYDRVAISNKVTENICKATKFQNTSYWKAERQIRITGSSAYELYTYSQNQAPDWDKKLKAVIFSTFKGNTHTEYGKAKEEIAKNLYKSENNLVLPYVGLIINPKFPWFGFSPDTFAIKNNEIILIEIKSLKLGRFNTGIELCKKLHFLSIINNNEVKMKENSKYYAQIQLGLAICNLRKAKLLLYVDVDKSLIKVDVSINIKF